MSSKKYLDIEVFTNGIKSFATKVDATFRKIKDSYTKTEIDNKLTSIAKGMNWKESVADKNTLTALTDNTKGDARIVESEAKIYLYNGTTWVAIGSSVNAPNASELNDGLMSSADFTKLKGIDTDALATKTDITDKTGDITTLTTTDKTNLVKAINEVKDNVDNKSQIDDTKVAETSTYSSKKVDDTYVKKESNKSLVDDTEIDKIHSHTNAAQLNKISEDTDGNFTYGGKAIKIECDEAISETSTNPLQNKAIKVELDKKVSKEDGKDLMTSDEKTKLAKLTNYELPIASALQLGGIKVGTNLSIDEKGVLSAKASDGGASIDDTKSSKETTYSSDKLETDFIDETEEYTENELKAMIGLSDDDIANITNYITDENTIATNKTWNSSVINKKINNMGNVKGLTLTEYKGLQTNNNVNSTIPYIVLTDETVGDGKKALMYYNNQLYNLGSTTTSSNEVQQKVSLNPVKNTEIQIVTNDENNKLMVECYKFVPGENDQSSILKEFNNANEDNFIYNSDETEFDDDSVQVKNHYELTNTLNEDGLYETVININDYIEFNGIEVIE